jgi:hypothetical protein
MMVINLKLLFCIYTRVIIIVSTVHFTDENIIYFQALLVYYFQVFLNLGAYLHNCLLFLKFKRVLSHP